MQAPLDESQVLLRDTVSRYLTQRFPIEERSKSLAMAQTQPPRLWAGLANDLGVLGASIPEELGGLGGGFAEEQLLLETLGDSLAAEPYLSSIVIGTRLLRLYSQPWAAAVVQDVCAGAVSIALAHQSPDARHAGQIDTGTTLRQDADGGWILNGVKGGVLGAPWASWLAVTARDRCNGASVLAFVPASATGVSIRSFRTLDDCVAGTVCFQEVSIDPKHVLCGPDVATDLEATLDRATLGICAEALGVCRRMLRDTVDYMRQRQQFGTAIATFQALQHRIADMHLAIESAAAITHQVGSLENASMRQRTRAVSSAKIAVNKACRTVGQGAVQLHGAMGTTAELALGHYFRRATLIESLFGSTDYHVRRIARLA